jgi:hypothetical protein
VKEQYVEDRFKPYFVFGEHQDGDHVDVFDRNDCIVAGVSREVASKLIEDRSLAIDMIIELALKLDEVAPDEFQKIWYGNANHDI